MQQLALSKRYPKVISDAPFAKKPTRLPHDNLLHAPKENNIALFLLFTLRLNCLSHLAKPLLPHKSKS